MAFKAPTILQLKALVEKLKQNYQGMNSQYHSFIILLDEILKNLAAYSPKKVVNIILGAIAFERAIIRSQASYFYPVEKNEFYRLLNECMGINADNPFDHLEEMIYLFKFYQFAGKIFPEQGIDHLKDKISRPAWTSKALLIKNIHAMLRFSKKENKEKSDQIVYGTPTLIALREHTERIPELYYEARKNRYALFQSSSREPMLRIFRLIHDSWLHRYPKTVVDKLPVLQQTEYDVRFGLLLLAVLDIHPTYRVFSPHGTIFNSGSELYKLTLAKLGAPTNLHDIPYATRIERLIALAKHIEDMQKDETFYARKKEEWKAHHFDLDVEINQFLKRLGEIRKVEEVKETTPSRTLGFISSTVSYITHGAIMAGIGFGATTGAGTAIMGSVTAMTGPIGIIVCATGAIVITGIGRAIGVDISTTVYNWIAQKIASAVGDKAVDVMSRHFKSKERRIEDLLQHLKSEDQHIFQKYINTLLKLPDDVFLPQEKERIRNVFGISKDSKWHFTIQNHGKEEQIDAKANEELENGFVNII